MAPLSPNPKPLMRTLSRPMVASASVGAGKVSAQTAPMLVLGVPSFVNWIQVDTLTVGDVAVVQTQSNTYYLTIIGPRLGFLWTTNSEVSPQEVVLHGSINPVDGQVVWGRITLGHYFLFAELTNSSDGTKTSVVTKLLVRKAGWGNVPIGSKLGTGVSTNVSGKVADSPSTNCEPAVKPQGSGQTSYGLPSTPQLKPPLATKPVSYKNLGKS